MPKTLQKIPRPLLILLSIMLIKWMKESGGTFLGTRTVKAIDDFKATIGPIAKKVEAETGISARLGLIQSSLESGYLSSKLSQAPHYNIFGFKCGEAWIKASKPYVMMPTKDYYKKGQKMPNGETATKDNQELVWPAPFRSYGSYEESYRDWARLMQTSGYTQDGAIAALRADDLHNFGLALSKRYAPNQNYEIRLLNRGRDMGLA